VFAASNVKTYSTVVCEATVISQSPPLGLLYSLQITYTFRLNKSANTRVGNNISLFVTTNKYGSTKNKNRSCCSDSRSYCLQYDVRVRCDGKLSNRFSHKLTNGWYARSDSTAVEFMNAPKLNPLKSAWPKFTKSMNNRLIVCHKKTNVRVFFDSFFLAFCG